MTPQSSFMYLAPIAPAREAELRELLNSMNTAPGRVNANNSLIPFAEFDRLHFARVLILEDKTTGDVRAHGLPVQAYPLYLTFLGDIDGEEEEFLQDLVRRASNGLRALFACCEGFTATTDLAKWLRQHRSPSIANYVNCRGRTVRQVREEAALREVIESYLTNNVSSLQGLSPRDLHAKLRGFVTAEQSAGRVSLSEEGRTPTAWWIRDALHLVGVPLIILVALPLAVVLAPFYLIRLRQLERTDPEICPTVDQEHSTNLSLTEDHDVTNQFSAMGSLKPGLVRTLTILGVLSTVDFAARHIVRPGRLGRIRTIHFARWVFIAGNRRMAFFSNYDGSVESYMDDFINKTGFGLNASFGNGIGYPRTNWLVLDGCSNERKYKEFLRRHTVPTQVWYKAYPGLTAIELERNTRLRRGLESPTQSDEEARDWVALL
jgi:hypothetical protein